MSVPYRLLVVDDEPFNRDLLVRRLRPRGFVVDEAIDGMQCLSRLEEVPFDLVLLDINMPGLSGLEVVQQIRHRWSYDTLPVILVTALSDPSDMVAGLEAGANDYVTKPVSLPILLARLRVALRIKQQVALLTEAERQRAMIETLGNACNQLSQPLTATTMILEMILRDPEGADPEQLRPELTQVLKCTQEASAVIHRLRAIAQSQALPYSDRLKMLEQDLVKLKRPGLSMGSVVTGLPPVIKSGPDAEAVAG